ncbi:Hypothetical predicted protein [Cloeon dipterum]|uniref:Venom dipeptidyl peptidase 4 n=1 Tax=Cloeon dipterum TaxID=197152 RepID=A0A8S1DZ47_9INSE|nr:Hypothetical predicted protein [Cloeon dipterum]
MSEEGNFDDEELVSSNANQRNWRGILIALLVIVFVLALIVTSVVLLTPPDEGPRVKGHRFKLADVLGHEFLPLRFNGTWVSPHELVYLDHHGGISLLNVLNASSKVLMNNQTFRRLNSAKFTLSPDHRYILLAHNVQKLFRHSYLAQYTVFDISTTELFPLTPTPEDPTHPYLLHAAWTPKQGHALVIVYEYDIYYRPGPRGNLVYRVTSDAVPGVISNGVPDWVYEEEVLDSNLALWFAEDGLLISYATFNDSRVEELKFPWFGSLDEGKLYPDIRSLRYPKPDTPNPTVTLWVADLADPKNIRKRDLKPPSALDDEEFYFTSVTWVSLTELSVVWMNRAQNFSLVSVCKSPLWMCQEVHRVTIESRGWVPESRGPPLFSKDSASFVTLTPIRDGSAGRFMHVTLVDTAKSGTFSLTHGRFDVASIEAWDHVENKIYFLAAPEGRPGQQHLWRFTLSGNVASSPQCLTCPYPDVTTDGEASYMEDSDEDVDPEDALSTTTTTTAAPRKSKKGKPPPPPHPSTLVWRPCLYHTAVFSPNKDYVVVECLGPGVPFTRMYTTRESPDGLRLIATLQNNTKLQERAAGMALPQVKTFPVQISGGYHARVRLHLPPGLREDEITQYPLVVHIYGGPGSQLVTERWRLDWNTYLASKRDYIVAQIDGRGSGGQGEKLLHEVYHRLGTVEVKDQLEVTEYLRDTFHFIDKRRVAVWGWSYGGFVAAMALGRDQDIFQCGISVAPVTNWKLYDSVYAERYMGSPNVTANYKGYDEADVTKRAEFFRDKMFYLIHGTADDNVHFQQSMMLAKALTFKGVLFRQQVYPDESHNLNGVKRHLYRSMANFLDDCFRKQMPPDAKPGLKND